jgi:hypothetical protein
MATPDDLVNELFALQNAANPDDDPGDLSIDVQDDSALHAVFQRGRMIAYGGSIQEALEQAVQNWKDTHGGT